MCGGGGGGGNWSIVASILFCLFNLSGVNFVMFIEPQLQTDVTSLFFFFFKAVPIFFFLFFLSRFNFYGMVFKIMNCPAFIIIFIYNNSLIISVIKHKGDDFLLFQFLFFFLWLLFVVSTAFFLSFFSCFFLF